MKADSIILLALVLIERANEVWGFNSSPIPVEPHAFPSSSPLPVASSAWATSNDGVAQSTRTGPVKTDTDGQRRRPKTKAPLVDSALLRFLSSQKNHGAVSLKNESDESYVGSAVSIGMPAAPNPAEMDVPSFATQDVSSTGAGLDRDTAILQPVTDETSNRSPENLSWLGQYNAQRVALKLEALGVDNVAANQAGHIVQDYVLARVTRRRIRKFLQERDAMWESGCSMPLDSRSGMSDDTSRAAASTFDIDSVISVLTEYGLTGTDVAAILSHTPSLVMMRARRRQNNTMGVGERKSFTLEDTVERAFVRLLGETLKLRRYDARKILRTCPGLLTSKGSASAEQVVKLMVSLGSSTSSIARDKPSLPILLSRSPALIFRLVAFLSSAQLKIPLNAIGPILRQKQSAEMLNAVAPLKRLPSFESAHGNFDAKNISSNVGSEILSYFRADGTMRQQRIEENYRSMEAVADVLRRNVGIKDFRKILSSYPHAFFLNVTNIVSVADYLQEDAGLTRDDVAKAFQTFPSLMELDVSRIKVVVDYLLSLNVEKEALPSILRSFPATLTLDVESNMIPVTEFLRDIGVRNLGRFVTRLPPVLGYSVEHDLEPKWEFLREVCQFDYFEIVRFPAYFSYPLERVIKMRYEYLRDRKNIPLSLIRIDDVLRFGDRDFANEIALDNDNGAAFAKYVKEHSSTLQLSKRARREQRMRRR